MKSRFLKVALVTIALVVLVSILTPTFALARDGTPVPLTKPAPYVEGEAIVRFRSNVTPGDERALVGAVNSESVVAETVGQTADIVLVRFPKTIPVAEMINRLKANRNIASVEPNHIVQAYLPAQDLRQRAQVLAPGGTDKVQLDMRSTQSGEDLTQEVTVKELQAAGVWPAKEYNSWGWSYIGAQVIYPEVAASPQVAVLDSGVDYLHPDLAGKVVKGRDFINDDADPMDDYGTGTMLAGLVAAKINNGLGISGVSNGSVVAIKVLDSQGIGTAFDLIQGIRAAANMASVKVIVIGVGTFSLSNALYNEVNAAVNNKGKLLVAAAGDEGVVFPFYPAAYSAEWPGKVLAVAGSGIWLNENGEPRFLNQCRSEMSNYGNWVSLVAPATDLYSTTPYDKPFYLNQYSLTTGRYSTYSGTPLAAALVAGSAARIWSLHTTWTNAQIGNQLVNNGRSLDAWVNYDVSGSGDYCWPAEAPAHLNEVMVSKAMGREAIAGYTYEGTNALPLIGAQHTAWYGTAVKGYGGKIGGTNSAFWSIINLPRLYGYKIQVNKTGYTAIAQQIDSVPNTLNSCPSCNYWLSGEIGIPPMTANPTFVSNWSGYDDAGNAIDLDNMLWLPPDEKCLVGNPDLTDTLACRGNGTLLSFPFARRFRNSHGWDTGLEATGIKFLYPTTFGPYKFYLWDSGRETGEGLSQQAGAPIVRLWRNGKLIATVNSKSAMPAGAYECIQQGGGNWCPYWYVGDLTSAGVFTVQNKFVDENEPLPY